MRALELLQKNIKHNFFPVKEINTLYYDTLLKKKKKSKNLQRKKLPSRNCQVESNIKNRGKTNFQVAQPQLLKVHLFM